MKDTVRHLFFDLDNTLWDFSANSALVLERIFESFGMTGWGIPDYAAFHSVYLDINETLWKDYALGRVKREEVRFRRFYDTLCAFGIESRQRAAGIADAYLAQTSLQTRLIPHAREVLAYLYVKYRLHIITNGFDESQYVKLRNTRIVHFFNTVTTAESAGALKPDTKIFHTALSRAGSLPEESIYIGDTPDVDGQGAVRSGMRFIWFNAPGTRLDHDFHHEIRALNELMEIL